MDEVKFGIIPGSACGSFSQATISMSPCKDHGKHKGFITLALRRETLEYEKAPGWVLSALSGHPEFVRSSSAYMLQSIPSYTENTHHKVDK